MTLLREIQAAAIDSTVDVMSLLRKARVLAARLGNSEFESWVLKELGGYSDNSDLPPYRIIAVRSKAHLLFPLNSQLSNAPIMPSQIPEKFRDLATTAYLKGPISSYADLVANKERDSDTALQAEWPQEVAVRFGGKGYNAAQCLRAWQEIGSNQVTGVLDAVRNRILEFALQIEKAAPEAGEDSASSQSISQDQVTQIFNTTINGDVHHLSSGTSLVSHTHSVKAGDLESLFRVLKTAGVPDTSLEQLDEALRSKSDKKAAVESWFGKLAMSAATGAIDVVIKAAGKAISAYLGMPPV